MYNIYGTGLCFFNNANSGDLWYTRGLFIHNYVYKLYILYILLYILSTLLYTVYLEKTQLPAICNDAWQERFRNASLSRWHSDDDGDDSDDTDDVIVDGDDSDDTDNVIDDVSIGISIWKWKKTTLIKD